jgi:hypothetical protein
MFNPLTYGVDALRSLILVPLGFRCIRLRLTLPWWVCSIWQWSELALGRLAGWVKSKKLLFVGHFVDLFFHRVASAVNYYFF